MGGSWKRFWGHVKAGFALPRRAFNNCEGCYARPATCWTDDDVHLCQLCYEEIPPSPSPESTA